MPRIVGLVEHIETSAEVQQWLMEQEEGMSVTMCGCGQALSASASGKGGGWGGGQGFCGVGSPPTSARGALYPSGSGIVRVECGEHCTRQGSRKCF